jgi:hypothetical protein
MSHHIRFDEAHSKAANPASKKQKVMKSFTDSDDAVSDRLAAYPYRVDDDDHCETPKRAYEDICFILHVVATACRKSHSDLFIYDPFYCEGSMIQRLAGAVYICARILYCQL